MATEDHRVIRNQMILPIAMVMTEDSVRLLFFPYVQNGSPAVDAVVSSTLKLSVENLPALLSFLTSYVRESTNL